MQEFEAGMKKGRAANRLRDDRGRFLPGKKEAAELDGESAEGQKKAGKQRDEKAGLKIEAAKQLQEMTTGKNAGKQEEEAAKQEVWQGLFGDEILPAEAEDMVWARKRPRDVKEMLRLATPEAVRLLVKVMRDEDVKPELRVKCAESIMEKAYGKGAQAAAKDLNGSVVIALEGELADYAD